MRKILLVGLVALCGSFAVAANINPDAVLFGEDGEVSTPLTSVSGDAQEGKKIFVNRKLGNCLACHVNDDITDQPFHGEVGPPLNGTASRWNEAQLRGIIINSKMTFEDSIMPSFYRTQNGARTLEKFAGKTILEAQQVEDVLAYILTLKEE